MNRSYLSIGRIERRLSTGDTEDLRFEPGVNLLVGSPNTGKTKWLQTLDFLLGGKNPFEGAEEEGLDERYDAASAELRIGEENIRIERRWREKGAISKVFVDDQPMNTGAFQQFLMEKLDIPLLHYPKGNPMSGQTWPELSFRSLLRHIYRQQRFWGGTADQQPEGEQCACLLQFLGLAERLFTEEYGQLIENKIEVERLKARREQYGETLDELAREVLSEPGLSEGANVATVRDAEDRLTRKINDLRQRRTELILGARDQVIPNEDRGHVDQLGEERATLLVALAELRQRAKATAERHDEVRRYRTEIGDEIDRMTRAEDAGAILADLKVTHCPACDQTVARTASDPEHCFLCHQALHDEPPIEELGTVRLQFERDRLTGESKEAKDLFGILERDARRVDDDIAAATERLRMLENELTPARQAVSALVQDDVSAIDMALGEANERQRHLGRISAALELKTKLKDNILVIERKIEPLEAQVDEAERAIDFDAAAAQLEDGMNAYLKAIDQIKPGVWRHSAVTIDVSRFSFTIRVGKQHWQAALGGTGTLYFLMAYHYGLLALSKTSQCHYPGLSIIDVPGDFLGEAIKDKANFIVEPFINLLAQDEYKGAQLIITGVSFDGLEDGHRLCQDHVYIA